MPIPVRQRLEAKSAGPAVPVAKPAPPPPKPKQAKPPKPAPKAKAPEKPKKPPAPPKPPKAHQMPLLDPRAILLVPTTTHRLNRAKPPKNSLERFYSEAECPGVKVYRGILKCKHGCARRPFLFVKFVGPDGERELLASWRGDWPVTTEILSLQQFNPKGNGPPELMLIGIDPARMAESLEVFAAATAAYAEWKPQFDEFRARKFAEKKAAKEAKRVAAEGEKLPVQEAIQRAINSDPSLNRIEVLNTETGEKQR